MSGVYALYDDGAAAQRAVNSLGAAGVSMQAITIRSGEPIEGQPFSEAESSTWMWYIASAAGLAGLCFGAWLTRTTELAWPISTGNMAIVSWWPNLIVTFEMTMLFAIVATVTTLLVSAGLWPGRRVGALYDPEIMNGRILVGVANPVDADAVERALLAAGSEPKRL
jgi:hypothetical protein